jgi:predicted Zn-dependent protease
MSTFVVVQTLSDEHPESWRAFRGRAQGLERTGNQAAAGKEWDQAVRLAPTSYTLLVQAADFHGRHGDPFMAETYLRRAVAILPDLTNAYQHLAAHLLRRGQGREAHRVALDGLARAGGDPLLWDLVSEAYVAKGDLPAAVRARDASLAIAPEPESWRRLAELLEAAGDSTRARDARAKARGEG